MKIWLTRHGQTKYNKDERMQGLTDEPLNDIGIAQAEKIKEALAGVHFDAVYASPLDRAVTTASIISGIAKDGVYRDKRIIEVDFGKYELQKYHKIGLHMTAFWVWPEVIPAPESVETIESMVKRSSDFLRELEGKEYENVLVVCHGGIIRSMCGYLEDRKNGIKWRPKPQNCEVRVYESKDGIHSFVKSIKAE